MILAALTYTQTIDRASGIVEWQKSDGCIESDKFMRVSEDEVTYNKNQRLAITLSCAICSLCFLAQIVWFVMVIRYWQREVPFKDWRKKCCCYREEYNLQYGRGRHHR